MSKVVSVQLVEDSVINKTVRKGRTIQELLKGMSTEEMENQKLTRKSWKDRYFQPRVLLEGGKKVSGHLKYLNGEEIEGQTVATTLASWTYLSEPFSQSKEEDGLWWVFTFGTNGVELPYKNENGDIAGFPSKEFAYKTAIKTYNLGNRGFSVRKVTFGAAYHGE